MNEPTNIGDADPLPHSLMDERDIVGLNLSITTISSKELHKRITDENERLRRELSDFVDVCKQAIPFLTNHVSMTIDQGPADRIVLDKMEALISHHENHTK